MVLVVCYMNRFPFSIEKIMKVRSVASGLVPPFFFLNFPTPPYFSFSLEWPKWLDEHNMPIKKCANRSRSAKKASRRTIRHVMFKLDSLIHAHHTYRCILGTLICSYLYHNHPPQQTLDRNRQWNTGYTWRKPFIRIYRSIAFSSKDWFQVETPSFVLCNL